MFRYQDIAFYPSIYLCERVNDKDSEKFAAKDWFSFTMNNWFSFTMNNTMNKCIICFKKSLFLYVYL